MQGDIILFQTTDNAGGLGAIHPLFVHFPIALLIVGSVGLLWQILKPSEATKSFDSFVSGTLGLGFLGLLITIITGLFDMLSSPKTLAKENWIVTAILHIVTAVPLVVIYGIILYRRFFINPELPESSDASKPEPFSAPKKPDILTMIILIIGLCLILATGWFGGRLVYEYRVGIGA
jgi:uncharacterized membrane protein